MLAQNPILPLVPPAAPQRPQRTERTLIDEYLEKQRDLTAVESFSRRHSDGEFDAPSSPAQERYYRDLIPLTGPREGEQYAFEVDLDACSGCKACVTACHNLNGLDEDETWRSVGVLIGGRRELPVVQHVTTACHHCLEPACLQGCPVNAYEKHPITGIVKHLDDQCIGCQYCILKCPYDVPKYSPKRGIVRKCDMCSDRLAVSEAPACVQSCPNEAIRIRIVDRRSVIEESETHQFVPGAADPEYTLPTTSYKTTRSFPRNTLPADYHRDEPQHAHLPLVGMLVLTQLSVGAFAVLQVLEHMANSTILGTLRPIHAGIALGLGMLALGSSTLHLGRPFYAYRAILGIRTSWLSREILTFGLFTGLASAYAAAAFLATRGISLPLMPPLPVLGWGVVLAGMLGVFCSAMIYHDTRRAFWHLRYTGTKFLFSTLLLGVATALATSLIYAELSKQLTLGEVLQAWGRPAALAMAGLATWKLTVGLWTLRHLASRHTTPMKRTARLLVGPLRRQTVARLLLLVIGGILTPILISRNIAHAGHDSTSLAVSIGFAFIATLVSEFLERYLFFTAVFAPKMPGGLAN